MTRRTATESVTGMHVLTPVGQGMSDVAGAPDNPLYVAVTNRSEIQKVSITNPGLTNAQLRGEPLQVALTFPVTQPISGTVNIGNLPAVQTVHVDNLPAQTGLTDTQLRAAPINVAGAFYQTVQPVSGTVGVSSLPAVSIAGTVPVSGPITDTQLRASPIAVTVTGTVPVSGAFYPATQPVSGSVSVSNFPAFAGVTDVQLRATPLSVTGTVTLSNPTPQGLTDAQLRATPILAKSVSPDLFGTAVTGTVTTTAQTIGALAASLWAAGATHVVAVAAGALVPLLGAVTLPALSGASTILSPKGQPLMTQAEAAVVGVKVTVGTGTVVLYGYK